MAETEINNPVYSPSGTGALPRAQEKKGSSAKAHVVNGGGLCSTCNNARGCFYLASRGPALFCELFDNYMSPTLRTSEAAPQSADASVELRAAEEQTSKYSGLCVNCRHRATCMHPRPTGGVWHCEDYE